MAINGPFYNLREMPPPPTPEALYLQLGSLVAEMPDLANGPITPEVNRWLGQAAVLIELAGCNAVTVSTFTVASQNLLTVLRESNAQTIAAIVNEALARAERLAPTASRGMFISAGRTFDAITVVGKALSEAKTDVLLVDPYADHKVLTDYAVMTPEGVSVRLLAKAGRANLIKPAAEQWGKQFTNTRPLAVRLASAASLHDRLIVIDGKTAWSLGQSFNALAERAHTTLVRTPPEVASEKIAAYEAMWSSAVPLS